MLKLNPNYKNEIKMPRMSAFDDFKIHLTRIKLVNSVRGEKKLIL
jgi:hypothetical protein